MTLREQPSWMTGKLYPDPTRMSFTFNFNGSNYLRLWESRWDCSHGFDVLTYAQLTSYSAAKFSAPSHQYEFASRSIEKSAPSLLSQSGFASVAL